MALKQDDRADVQAFRVRSFVEQLAESGELEIASEAVPLSHIASRLDGNPKAVLFNKAGPEGAELVGNVLGSRKRLALAFGVDERDAMPEMMRRLAAMADGKVVGF